MNNNENYTITRKVQLLPIGDNSEMSRIYTYLRSGMYNQNKAYNELTSAVYSTILNGRLNGGAESEINEKLKEIYAKGHRNPKKDNRQWSLYDIKNIKPPKGNDTISTVAYKVKQDMDTAKSNGLFKGKVSLQNKKLDAPLWIKNKLFSFYHDYESDMEFQKHLYKSDFNIYMKFVNGITFKVKFGLPHKSGFLRSEFARIFDGTYKVGDSSIQLFKEKKKKIGDDNEKKEITKIILNLSLTIPKEKRELDENKIVGVDVGVAIPAVCALNDNKYSRQYLGSKDDLLRVRTQLQHQRQQLQRSLRFNSGGHGRKKKLKPLERLKARERNFVRTYNHKISKRVVDFALKNNAKYINIENLKGIDTSQFILRNWSY